MKASVINYIAVLKHLLFGEVDVTKDLVSINSWSRVTAAQLKQPDVHIVSIMQITCIFMIVNCVPWCLMHAVILKFKQEGKKVGC